MTLETQLGIGFLMVIVLAVLMIAFLHAPAGFAFGGCFILYVLWGIAVINAHRMHGGEGISEEEDEEAS